MSVALVTGGGSGIGLAIARSLLSAGFDVAIASLEPETEVASLLTTIKGSGRLVYRQFDVANIESHAALVESVATALGPIDCLVNNAGVTSLVRGDMLQLSAESFDRCVAVNQRGTFFLTQAVALSMIASGATAPATTYRSIVTITSANAEIVGVNRADYCITKAALSMMSKLFAARLARAGINVFEVRPGIIRTRMTAPATEAYDRLIAEGGVPIPRWGEAEDVGKTVTTIAMGLMPFTTGEVVNVGGGLHLHRV